MLRLCNGAWRDDDGDAVDIVEVVRCKDCKWYYKHIANYDYCCHKNPDGRWAQNFAVIARDDDFCSYGERKDGDGNG